MKNEKFYVILSASERSCTPLLKMKSLRSFTSAQDDKNLLNFLLTFFCEKNQTE